MDQTYDFCGWATKFNIKCSDGRTIMKDAFKHNDGQKIPLVWSHKHDDPNAVLGYAVLENRDEGVYAYGKFNESESGKTAKLLVEHGDVDSLSIYANQLKENLGCVTHGNIRELSLVLAGANIGAHIESVIKHGEELEDEVRIYSDELIELYHSEEAVIEHAEEPEKEDSEVAEETKVEETEKDENLAHADEEKKSEEKPKKTLEEVLNTLTDEQKEVVYGLIGHAIADAQGDDDDDNTEETKGGNNMKHNVFDTDMEESVLSHADQEAILSMAKSNTCGSLRAAIESYANDNQALAHIFDQEGEHAITKLFPEYHDLQSGAPETLTDDQTWVAKVINKVRKSPYSRIRTRQADARAIEELRAKGYKKGSLKTEMGNLKLISRTTDPQTIYIKDKLNRDDITDITDFDVVAYTYKIMEDQLKEEIATAILFGDGREDGDDKIQEDKIRPIWTDDELYTIHHEVDIEAAKTELQGTNTGANFSENYIYAEAIIRAALYSRESYKGSGALTFYCTPHLLNVMLLARDLNGRRIYGSKAELESALNVTEIVTIEQMEGKARAVEGGTKKLLGMFVNLADYQLGATKGGEITRFQQFDIDYNQEKLLIETRVSGANTRIKSAIVLEEPVAAAG